MKVRFGVYDTPQPEGVQRESKQHARVHSKGTIRLNEMCEELRDLGVNSAQIKGVLDAAAKFMAKSLRHGYNVELDGIGIFSISLRSTSFEDELEKKKTRVEIDGVNFRCNKDLKKRVQKAELQKDKMSLQSMPSLTLRKKRMIAYLEEHGYINAVRYADINNCSRYLGRKDLLSFDEEKLIVSSGKRAHKIYLINKDSTD